MKYQIIFKESSSYFLEDKVNEAIKEGWEPLGGVVVRNSEYYTGYYQAMTKREPEENDCILCDVENARDKFSYQCKVLNSIDKKDFTELCKEHSKKH